MAVYSVNLVPTVRPFVKRKTVVVAGVVQTVEAGPLERLVVIFPANNLSSALGSAMSSKTTGAFSFTLDGAPATEFAVVVQGEVGENCVVHSHKTGV